MVRVPLVPVAAIVMLAFTSVPGATESADADNGFGNILLVVVPVVVAAKTLLNDAELEPTLIVAPSVKLLDEVISTMANRG